MSDNEGIQGDAGLDTGTEDSNVGYMNPQTVQSFGAEAAARQEDVDDDDLDQDDDDQLDDEDEDDVDDDLEDDLEDEDQEPGQKSERKTKGKKAEKKAQKEFEKRKALAKKKHERRLRQIQGMQQQGQYGMPGQRPQGQPTQQPQQQPPQNLDLDIKVPQPTRDEDFASYTQRAISESLKGALQQLPQIIQQALMGGMPQQPQQQQPYGQPYGMPGQGPMSPQQQAALGQIQSSIAYLDEVYDDWQLYEDEMMALYRRNPGAYRGDLDTLYDDAKAAYDARNKKARAAKVKKKAEKVKVQSGRRPKGSTKTRSKKQNLMSMEEVWERAKRDAMSRRRR